MAEPTQGATVEAEIRKLLDSWTAAICAKDVAGIVAHYSPGIVAYDAVLALEFRGREAYRKHWEACLTMCEGPMSFALHEPTFEVSGDIAFCHALACCGGTGPDGEFHEGWTRMTACFRRKGGRWLTVHEHFSVPFDFETGKAMMDLKPAAQDSASAA